MHWTPRVSAIRYIRIHMNMVHMHIHMHTWTPCYQLIPYLSFSVHFHEVSDANQAYHATLRYGDSNEQGPV